MSVSVIVHSRPELTFWFIRKTYFQRYTLVYKKYRNIDFSKRQQSTSICCCCCCTRWPLGIHLTLSLLSELRSLSLCGGTPTPWSHLTWALLSSLPLLSLRYIGYVCSMVSEKPLIPHFKPLIIKAVTVSPVPCFNKQRSGCRPFCDILLGETKIFSTSQDYERMR